MCVHGFIKMILWPSCYKGMSTAIKRNYIVLMPRMIAEAPAKFNSFMVSSQSLCRNAWPSSVYQGFGYLLLLVHYRIAAQCTAYGLVVQSLKKLPWLAESELKTAYRYMDAPLSRDRMRKNCTTAKKAWKIIDASRPRLVLLVPPGFPILIRTSVGLTNSASRDTKKESRNFVAP